MLEERTETTTGLGQITESKTNTEAYTSVCSAAQDISTFTSEINLATDYSFTGSQVTTENGIQMTIYTFTSNRKPVVPIDVASFSIKIGADNGIYKVEYVSLTWQATFSDFEYGKSYGLIIPAQLPVGP